MGKKQKPIMYKKRLYAYIYSSATLQCKDCLMYIKNRKFTKSYKIMWNHIRSFVSVFFTDNKRVFGTQSNIYDEFFCVWEKVENKIC